MQICNGCNYLMCFLGPRYIWWHYFRYLLYKMGMMATLSVCKKLHWQMNISYLDGAIIFENDKDLWRALLILIISKVLYSLCDCLAFCMLSLFLCRFARHNPLEHVNYVMDRQIFKFFCYLTKNQGWKWKVSLQIIKPSKFLSFSVLYRLWILYPSVCLLC